MKNEDDYPGQIPLPVSMTQEFVNKINNIKQKASSIKNIRNRITIYLKERQDNIIYYKNLSITTNNLYHKLIYDNLVIINQENLDLYLKLDKWLQEEQYKLSKTL